MEELQARLMTCHRGSEGKTPEESGGYMPISPYEILNADETVRALISTINYNARRCHFLETENSKLFQELRIVKRRPKNKLEALKFIFNIKK